MSWKPLSAVVEILPPHFNNFHSNIENKLFEMVSHYKYLFPEGGRHDGINGVKIP